MLQSISSASTWTNIWACFSESGFWAGRGSVFKLILLLHVACGGGGWEGKVGG